MKLRSSLPSKKNSESHCLKVMTTAEGGIIKSNGVQSCCMRSSFYRCQLSLDAGGRAAELPRRSSPCRCTPAGGAGQQQAGTNNAAPSSSALDGRRSSEGDENATAWVLRMRKLSFRRHNASYHHGRMTGLHARFLD